MNLFRKTRRKQCIRISHFMFAYIMWKQTLLKPILFLCSLFPGQRARLVGKLNNTKKAKAEGLQYTRTPAQKATARSIPKPAYDCFSYVAPTLVTITDPCSFWLYFIRKQGVCKKSIIWTQSLPPIPNNYMVLNKFLF